MIEGFLQIGKEILKQTNTLDKFCEFLTLDIEREKKGKKQHIVILKITDKGKNPNLTVEVEEISKDTPIKYLWIGNSSANSLQDKLTTNNIEYLVSQTIPNLIQKLKDCKLKDKLKKLKTKLYVDIGDKDKVSSTEAQYDRYRLVWNLSNLGIDLNLQQEVKKAPPNKKGITAVKLVANKIMDYINKQTKLKKEEIALFTICYNNEILAQDPDYKEYIYKSLVEEVFKNALEGNCHLCNTYKKVTWDTTRFWFKFYMTDKVGFSSNLKGKEEFIKNFSICEDCYKAIIACESFIRNNLVSFLLGYSVYIIPELHLNEAIPIEKIEKWAEFFSSKFNSVSSLEGMQRFQEKLEQYIQYEKIQDSFTINFLFARKVQSAFKIYQLIQDVPPSRLDKIRERIIEIKEFADKLFGEDKKWYLGLEEMSKLFPTFQDSKFILQFYNCIFLEIPFSYNELINQFVRKIREMRFVEKFEDLRLCFRILQQYLLLKFLIKSGLLKGENKMESEVQKCKNDEEIGFKEFGYSTPQYALFLLGCVIAIIGAEQYKKGDSRKAILNKIQFQGMNINKIERLYNEIFEKMRQYRVVEKAENFYSYSKVLFDKYKNNWNLSPQENVFYILSGYSYITYKKITSKENTNYKQGEKQI